MTICWQYQYNTSILSCSNENCFHCKGLNQSCVGRQEFPIICENEKGEMCINIKKCIKEQTQKYECENAIYGKKTFEDYSKEYQRTY